jgi:hypothetical protein
MVKQVIAGAAGAALVGLTAGVVAAQVPQQVEEEQIRARQRLVMMEAVLERAVQNGADNVIQQVKNVTPDQPTLSGPPQVRGFRINGYGIFFDVEVPQLRLPILWPMRFTVSLNRDAVRTVQEMRLAIQRLEGDDRARLEAMLRQLENDLRGTPGRLRGAPDVSAALLGGNVRPAVPGAVGLPGIGNAVPVNPDVVDDPERAYTDEVKAALVDAMIDHGGALNLGPEEWIIVGARDNAPRDPLVPGDTVDFSTWIFRLKGSDLAEFRAGRLTLQEARTRVEMREY